MINHQIITEFIINDLLIACPCPDHQCFLLVSGRCVTSILSLWMTSLMFSPDFTVHLNDIQSAWIDHMKCHHQMLHVSAYRRKVQKIATPVTSEEKKSGLAQRFFELVHRSPGDPYGVLSHQTTSITQWFSSGSSLFPYEPLLYTSVLCYSPTTVLLFIILLWSFQHCATVMLIHLYCHFQVWCY